VLRQLFKPITLAICVDGIALRIPGQPARMLTKSPTNLATNELLLSAFAEVLQDTALQKSHKSIRLVISNRFVRYSVLPWQSEITSREDWIAIAQHDFHKRYGPVAEDWKVCVSLDGFGHNIVAAAIDESLLNDLTSIARDYGCKLAATEPFLVSVLKQYKPSNDKQWLLIAEPERVLLCEISGNQCQRFSIISPPHQQEVEQALMLVNRSIQSVEPENRPTHILNCSAPSLSSAEVRDWRSDQVIFKTWPKNIAIQNSSSALWMAGF
jgi:hypothetical protein